jgi:methionyl-tRNA formyltransferase
MRIVFMGTPDFAAVALAALLDAGRDVVAVYSQPPRPAGRGQKDLPSPVHVLAGEKGLPVETPTSLKTGAARANFEGYAPDVAVVAAYGLILPPAILAAPAHGCLNIHASLLPRWRGAAPIQRAIEAGDRETGVTIMQMDEGLDTGDMLLTRKIPIGTATTGGELHNALADLGAAMIVEALALLDAGALTATPQPEDGVTYAHKIDKAETRLDWTQPAADLANKVRAFNPWPGTFFELDGQRIRVLAAEAVAGDGPPGARLDDGLTIACGHRALRLIQVQRPGKSALDAADFLRGWPRDAAFRIG